MRNRVEDRAVEALDLSVDLAALAFAPQTARSEINRPYTIFLRGGRPSG